VGRSRGSISLCRNLDKLFYTTYLKGAILEDKQGMGFFCFKTKKAAEKFRRVRWLCACLKIIRIETLCRGKVPKRRGCLIPVKFFYASNDTTMTTSLIPQGTICYKKIKVLN